MPPNVVLVVVDDLGYSDLACYGNSFHETPAFDALAAQGVRFTDAYAAAPVCSPTRAAILTGRHPARLGLTAHIPGHWRPFERLVEPRSEDRLALEHVTLAELLAAGGYATAHFGKWDLGPLDTHGPRRQGFQESIVTRGGHVAPRFSTFPDVKLPPGTRLTSFLTDRAIDFASRHRDRPFFVQLWHFALHVPLDGQEQLAAKYREKAERTGRKRNPVYAAMLEELDASLGRLLAKLDELGLGDRTLVVVTSDNGGLVRRYDGKGDTVTDNAPLRGEKGTLYEGGIRVPLLVRWPGVTPPGGVCSDPCMSTDLLPTLAAACGAAPPEPPLDGRDLGPLLRNPRSSLGRPTLYWHYPHYHHSRPAGALRHGRYKLLEFFDTGALELYDLAVDPGEEVDLSEHRPGLARRLQRRLRDWRTAVGARLPMGNRKYDPARAGEWWSRRTHQPLH